MDRVEPRSANDYNDRTTTAVRSVLVEIGQILGSFEGKFAVIGGAGPWLLLSQAEMAHVRNYPGGIDELVSDTMPFLKVDAAKTGYRHIASKFRTHEDYGPTRVREFVEGSTLLGPRTPDQWQQDAFGQVNAWLAGVGLR